MTAYDTLRPARVATATVNIQVTRNQNAPVFTLPSYSTSISENTVVGSVIFNVTATDADANVSIKLLCISLHF